MSDEVQPEVVETSVDEEATGPPKVDEIVITITDQDASYRSSLPPQEIIFWLNLMNHMILNGMVQAEMQARALQAEAGGIPEEG